MEVQWLFCRPAIDCVKTQILGKVYEYLKMPRSKKKQGATINLSITGHQFLPHLTLAHSISPAPEGVIACTVEQNLKNKDDHKKYNKASALEAHPFMQTTVLCYSPALCTLGEQPWMISLSPLTQHSQNDLANNNL